MLILKLLYFYSETLQIRNINDSGKSPSSPSDFYNFEKECITDWTEMLKGKR